jgi:hypothetical protein
MHALPRMEVDLLDAGHKLLETHAAVASSCMLDFSRHTQRTRERAASMNDAAIALIPPCRSERRQLGL